LNHIIPKNCQKPHLQISKFEIKMHLPKKWQAAAITPSNDKPA
jgi:hypothetical protein